MAIKLDKTLPDGFVANYWCINTVVIDSKCNVIVSVYLYKDKAAKNAGYDAAACFVYNFPGLFVSGKTSVSIKSAFDITSDSVSNPWALAYAALKQHPDFLGGKDV